MNERILNEFAAYYKRVIRVERYLKDLIYEKYTEMYGNKAYEYIYNRYLSSNKNNFRRLAKNLKDFRNCICHFDIKQFNIDRNALKSQIM